MKQKIILDTNFLIYCVENKIDFVSEIDKICDFEYELDVLSQILDELKQVSVDKELNYKEREVAKVALDLVGMLINTQKVNKIEAPGKDGDEAILGLKKREEIILATMDKELRSKIRKSIIVRGKKSLRWA